MHQSDDGSGRIDETPPASGTQVQVTVDIGIFAHDEAGGIGAMIDGLMAQDILDDPAFSVRVLVLANGCTDATADAARQAAAAGPHPGTVTVQELADGGKSRTWNAFVHALSRDTAGILVFADADIAIPDPTALRRLVAFLGTDPHLAAASSRPVKDLARTDRRLSLTERVTAAAGGTLNDWRRAICGQLYAMRAEAARGFHLPIGLPVEDGFVRAMITTDVLRRDPDITRLDGREDIFHIYPSEREIGALIGHQTRIVIGSAINAVLFGYLDRVAPERANAALADAAADPEWLDRVLATELPTARSGYVPWHFLVKRLARIGREKGLKRRIMILAGFGFDAVVWVNAQIKMARGAGAGYW